MKHEIFTSLRAIILIPIAVLCMASTAKAQSASSAGMSQEHMQAEMMGSDAMKKSMMSGMDGMQKMQLSGDPDKDFAMMMKMHHQKGIEMAQMELDHGKSPAMKTMAKKIISAQKKESAQFDQWLAKQK
jgi:uncharacterized protein (DUF305 family)